MDAMRSLSDDDRALIRSSNQLGKTRTRADAPVREIDKDFWEHAHVVMPGTGKTSVHLRVDSDVLEWFRKQGRGHLSRMNAVLRSYVEAARGRR